MTTTADETQPAMPTNIEIKAKTHDPRRQETLAAELSNTGPVLLDQVDTFFNVPSGRLKLREMGADRGELIRYDRPDIAGPKSSSYSIFKTDQPAVLRELLAAALGVRGIVRKRRKLYLVGQTRVHIDKVVGLGPYIELEVVLSPGQSRERGEAIAREIMRQLDIHDDDLVEGAYIDLLAAGRPSPQG